MEAEIKEEEVPIETETVPAPPKPTFNGPWELKRGTIPTGRTRVNILYKKVNLSLILIG